MPGPLYPSESSPGYPLDRRLGGPQSLSGRRGEEILDPTGKERSVETRNELQKVKTEENELRRDGMGSLSM
jgi:hypothetical protein